MAPKYQKGPDLKRFMDKRLRLSLNGNRKVVGTLRGYDAFLNVVLEEALDESNSTTNGSPTLGTIVIRGNSIVQLETLERI
mmetsp:Transcript_17516/g.31607  ORF Transcript_17516/g.31607 Transcript_17516/m.31607 type:complete len:81 (+) Transcript_17516:151-393(+)|eukprot:CAMPEP_0198281200 /NCGR_PEP_ID=MMETSP1449-20131203/1170_1 /TAXON_ID=420275 /ORGANISM="Attheya septentrionalis, Strain CCMP2084" /LENGTH=80 /DNA_ID=CAMNT_0043976867 /DNA_START=124 /DNA_END=366 /DNA_ORIENTATION=+